MIFLRSSSCKFWSGPVSSLCTTLGTGVYLTHCPKNNPNLWFGRQFVYHFTCWSISHTLSRKNNLKFWFGQLFVCHFRCWSISHTLSRKYNLNLCKKLGADGSNGAVATGYYRFLCQKNSHCLCERLGFFFTEIQIFCDHASDTETKQLNRNHWTFWGKKPSCIIPRWWDEERWIN